MQLRLLFSFLFCAMLSTAFSQTSIGIIGTATPNGWDSDTDMVQSQDSAHLWSLTITLTQGLAKFRQDNDWAVNWGATDFPTGVGTQGGADIPVAATGEYNITFNSITGAYDFGYRSDIGIIGNATPGGWDNDTDLYRDAGDTNKYFRVMNFTVGAAKFRKDNAWTVNWGALGFPQDTAVQGGPDIPIAVAGKYRVDFDKSTGIYLFTEVVEFVSIGIIGSATPGGWDTDTDLTKDASNPDLWKGTFDLVDGKAKFRANDAWAINWGDSIFPISIATLGGPDIPVTAGRYLVSLNVKTGEYKFLLIGDYTFMSIIGDATPGGWDNDTYMTQDPNDESIWKVRLVLTDGDALFRADTSWASSWGAGDFPSGVATLFGANIPISAGEYKVTFNSTTGEYNFEILLVYSTVGLIGPSTPNANWDTDVDMTRDAVNESFWEIPSIVLTDGFAKFRAEDAWTVNWGLEQWPSGVGVQNGKDIPVTGGTYRVTLNSDSGDYAFGPTSSTTDLLQSNSISVAPNPAKDVMNVTIEAAELQGDVHVILFNTLGQRVLEQNMTIQQTASINVAGIVPGNYTLHITNGKYIVGKSVVLAK
jgi:starch-binding outer membrane protein SusE/F